MKTYTVNVSVSLTVAEIMADLAKAGAENISIGNEVTFDSDLPMPRIKAALNRTYDVTGGVNGTTNFYSNLREDPEAALEG